MCRDERRAHLNLFIDCDERGGTSKEFKGLLAYHLNTSIPIGKKILLCHACHNGKCSNVNHLYWGTYKDNHIDYMENGGLTFWEKSVKKYGINEATKRRISGLETSRGHSAYSSEKIAEYRKVLNDVQLGKRGWISRAAIKLKISHTQVRRFSIKHAQDLLEVNMSVAQLAEQRIPNPPV